MRCSIVAPPVADSYNVRLVNIVQCTSCAQGGNRVPCARNRNRKLESSHFGQTVPGLGLGTGVPKSRRFTPQVQTTRRTAFRRHEVARVHVHPHP